MRSRERSGLGAVVFGLIIVGIGTYYLLTNTFGLDLPELDWDLLWPVLVIGLGIAILYRATRERLGRDKP
jgi:hypothetical protein